MSYEKQTWTTGETITAEKLNHIEDGIAEGGTGGLNLVPHYLTLRFMEKQTVGAKTTIEATPENSEFRNSNGTPVDLDGKIIVPIAFVPNVTGIDFAAGISGIEINEFTGELTYRFGFTNNSNEAFEFTKNDSLVYAIGYYADDQSTPSSGGGAR